MTCELLKRPCAIYFPADWWRLWWRACVCPSCDPTNTWIVHNWPVMQTNTKECWGEQRTTLPFAQHTHIEFEMMFGVMVGAIDDWLPHGAVCHVHLIVYRNRPQLHAKEQNQIQVTLKWEKKRKQMIRKAYINKYIHLKNQNRYNNNDKYNNNIDEYRDNQTLGEAVKWVKSNARVRRRYLPFVMFFVNDWIQLFSNVASRRNQNYNWQQYSKHTHTQKKHKPKDDETNDESNKYTCR